MFALKDLQKFTFSWDLLNISKLTYKQNFSAYAALFAGSLPAEAEVTEPDELILIERPVVTEHVHSFRQDFLLGDIC